MANTLQIIVKAKDEASRALSGVEKALDGIGTKGASLGSVLKGVGTAAGIGLAAIGTAAAAAGGALAKLALDAMPVEGIAQAFDGITDSADEMLAALRKGSLGMVADIDLMKNYNLAAQLVGQTFADQLPDAMGYLTKVSAATGTSMDYMIDSLVRGVGRLSPMILDNLGISLNLADAYAEYAATVGKSTDELTKAEQQTAVMNKAMALLAENTAEMPDIMGTAAQGWAALRVQFQNAKMDIGRALLPALQDLMNIIGPLVQEWLPQLTAEFQAGWVPAIRTLIGALGAMIGGDMTGGLTQFFGLFEGLLQRMGTTAPQVTQWLVDAWAKVELAWGWVRDRVWIPLREWLAEKVPLAWAALQPSFEALREWLAEKVPLAWAALQPSFEALRGWLAEKVPVAWEAMKGAFEQAKTWLETTIPTAIQTAIDWWNRLRAAWNGDSGDALGASSGAPQQTSWLEHVISVSAEVYTVFERLWGKLQEIYAMLYPPTPPTLWGVGASSGAPDAILQAGMAGRQGIISRLITQAQADAAAIANPPIKEPTFWDRLKEKLELFGTFWAEHVTPLLTTFFEIHLVQWGWLVNGFRVWIDRMTEGWNIQREGLVGEAGMTAALERTRDWFDKVMAAMHLVLIVSDMLTEGKIPSLESAFDRLGSTLDAITGKLRTIKGLLQDIGNLNMGNFQPGSPTPFELGLRGISSAMDTLNERDLPRLHAMAAQLASIRTAQAAGNVTNNTSYNLTVHSSARSESVIGDFAMLRAMTV